jgi:DNA-directed RNA polymerase subunit RPC12/RpoP
MQNSGKLMGIFLIVAALACGGLGGGWVLGNRADGQLETGGAILATALVAVIALPLLGAGVFVLLRAGREDVELARVAKQRKLLNVVLTQGQARISEVALEMDASRDEVKAWLHDLVGKGLFSGYVNWDEGVLYSRQASKLKGNRCPNCAGEVKLAGQGVVTCPYCGTEIFLTD